jgi:hypothetical protein
MKFTKDQAVEKLNQKLTNDGKKPLRMSARTLESQVETLLAFVNDEEMELDDFVDKVKASLENINSNMEKDQSDFIKDYKKSHPENEDKGGSGAGSDNGAGGGSPSGDANAELLRRLEELERKAEARALEDSLKAKRAAIKKYLGDNNVTNETWIESMLGMIQVGQDDDPEAKGQELVELFNKTAVGNPLVPGSPKPGGGLDPEHAFDDVKRALKARSGETS